MNENSASVQNEFLLAFFCCYQRLTHPRKCPCFKTPGSLQVIHAPRQIRRTVPQCIASAKVVQKRMINEKGRLEFVNSLFLGLIYKLNTHCHFFRNHEKYVLIFLGQAEGERRVGRNIQRDVRHAGELRRAVFFYARRIPGQSSNHANHVNRRRRRGRG